MFLKMPPKKQANFTRSDSTSNQRAIETATEAELASARSEDETNQDLERGWGLFGRCDGLMLVRDRRWESGKACQRIEQALAMLPSMRAAMPAVFAGELQRCAGPVDKENPQPAQGPAAGNRRINEVAGRDQNCN